MLKTRTRAVACCSQTQSPSQLCIQFADIDTGWSGTWEVVIAVTTTWPSPPTIAGVNVQQNFAPIPLALPFRSEPQPDPKGTEGVILLFVTVKVISPDRRSDYKNYLTRDVHSNDVQSLNRVKTLLQEELVELRAWILTWVSIGAISKYGCVLTVM